MCLDSFPMDIFGSDTGLRQLWSVGYRRIYPVYVIYADWTDTTNAFYEYRAISLVIGAALS